MTFPESNRDPASQPPDALGALTVLGEARGEPPEGKFAVANVICNRMRRSGKTVSDTVLAHWQFSCWNYEDPNRLFLEETIHKEAKNIQMGLWASCWTAFVEAHTQSAPDNTAGASHYCVSILWGVDDSGRSRPRWFSRQEIESGRTKETARIGSHVFAKAA